MFRTFTNPLGCPFGAEAEKTLVKKEKDHEIMEMDDLDDRYSALSSVGVEYK